MDNPVKRVLLFIGQNKKKVISLLIILIISIGVAVVSFGIKFQQDVRQRASGPPVPGNDFTNLTDYFLFDARSIYFDTKPYTLGTRPPTTFPPGKTAADLLTDYDTMMVLLSVQGLVNRSSPTFSIHSSDLDQRWIERLTSEDIWLRGATVHTLSNLDAVLTEFSQSRYGITGSVLWEESKPYTLSLATTVAGADNLVIVRKNSPLQSQITARFPVRVDLTAQNFPSKDAAYRWLVDNYLTAGKTKSTLATIKDGYPAYLYSQNRLTKAGDPYNEVQAWDSMMYDYFISQNVFLFDLAPPLTSNVNEFGQNTDTNTLQYITNAARTRLGALDLLEFWGYFNRKYLDCNGNGIADENFVVCGEYPFEKFIAEAGGINRLGGGESLGFDFANGSFYQHGPGIDFLAQNPPLTPQQLVTKGYVTGNPSDPSSLRINSNKKFIMLYMGDYDFANALYSIPLFSDYPCVGGACTQAKDFIPIWDNRGINQVPTSDGIPKLPVGWGIDPSIGKYFPPLFAYYAKTKNAGDYFVMPDSGAGYVNPGYVPSSYKDLLKKDFSYFLRPYGYNGGWVHNGMPATDNGHEVLGANPSSAAALQIREIYKVLAPNGVLYNAGFDRPGIINRFDDSLPAIPLGDSGFLGLGIGNIHCGFSNQTGLADCATITTPGTWEKYQAQSGFGNFFALRSVFLSPNFLNVIFNGEVPSGKSDWGYGGKGIRNLRPSWNIEIVDPVTFFSLFRLANGEPTIGRFMLTDIKINGVTGHPHRVESGRTYTMQVTLRNDGWDTWTPTTYRLKYDIVSGRQTPTGKGQDPAYFPYSSAVDLPSSVAPGATVTLSFPYQIPTATGEYTFQMDMFSGSNAFEKLGNVPWNKLVTVIAPAVTNTPPPSATPTPSPTPIPTPSPTPVPPTITSFVSPTCIPLGEPCAAPPTGCSYVGGDSCTCGTLVCTSTTPTSIPTQTPVPTSPVAPGTTFALTLKAIGVGNGILENNTPVRQQRTASIQILGVGQTTANTGSGFVTYYPGSQTFQGLASVGLSAPEGDYIVKVKMDGYLQKRVVGLIHVGPAIDIVNLPQVALIPGDINNDNALNITDYNMYRSCYGKSSSDTIILDGVRFSCSKIDLNDDGRIDSRSSEKDYRILLSSFSIREGD